MKSIVTDYLQHKFPANGNFLQYISDEMHTNLIMLCESLYPDSENNAYILSGLDRTSSGSITHYSSGIVFYNKEIFYVPAYSHPTPPTLEYAGLELLTDVLEEEYASGDMLPAYKDRNLAWVKKGTGSLSLENLIRRGCDIYDIEYTGSLFAKQEYRVISNHTTQTLTIHVTLLPAAITSTAGARLSVPGLERYDGF